MTITKRLQINFFLSAGVVLMLGLAFALALVKQGKAREQGLLAVQFMRSAYELNLLSNAYVRHPEERPKAQWKHQYDALVRSLQGMSHNDIEQAIIVKRMSEDLRSMDELFTETVATYERSSSIPPGSGHPAEPAAESAKLKQLEDLMFMRSRKISMDAAHLVRDNNSEIQNINRIVSRFALILTSTLMALVLWYSKCLGKSISVPLARLRSGADIIGEGNLAHRIGFSSTDELGALSTAFDRMTERLQSSREELSRTAEQLRLSNAYNRNLLEASLDPFVAIGPDGIITDVNYATEKVTGRLRDELIGTDFTEYFTEPEKARAGYEQAFTEGFVQDYPLEIRQGEGDITYVLYNASVYRDEGGMVIGVFAAARDITRLKLAEDGLMRVVAELERSNMELEQFAYVASHDLQEPLRMVSSYTQLLAERYEGQLDDKARKYIDYAVDGAVRMQRLINDLLIYSRINTKGKTPELIDSGAVLGEALRNLAVAVEESRATIVNDDLPTVRADAGQLSQLFQNLIGNAIKFRSADLPRIRVSARDHGQEWCFSVQDNGIGIDPQHADKVFVIFQRLHTRQEYPGTGIGLALCKRIAERHGGRIWFESESGKGSTFYFTLPK